MVHSLEPLRRLAADQAGLVTRTQARQIGIDRHHLSYRITAGEWQVVTTDLLLLVGSPATPHQSVLAATMAAGPDASLSMHSALAWCEIPGFDLLPAHTTLPRRTRRPTLGPVHTTNVWPDHHRTTRLGVPVTTVARALADLTPVIRPKRLERALDTAWAKGLVSGAMLQQVIDDLRRRGQPSLHPLQALLDQRGGDWTPPASLLERRFHDLIDKAGLSPFERLVIMGDEQGIIREVDAYDREAALVVEVDSIRFHSAPTDVARDQSQDARLRAIGLHVERVSELELTKQPTQVLARVNRIRRQRLAAPSRSA